MAHTEKCRGCMYENACNYIQCRREENAKSLRNADVKLLYEAFTQLCDYIEVDTGGSCRNCPRNKVCFGTEGNKFAEALQRVRKAIGME